MLAVAVAGLAVNIGAFLILHGADRESLNVKGAMLHVLGDLLGSVAAIAAALVILWTGWTPIDPLLSVLVAVLILRSAWFLVGESGHILLEAAPRGLDVRTLKADLVAAIPGVEDVHHVHAWSLTEDKRMATLHVRVAGPRRRRAAISAAVKAHLRDRFRIEHATVEVEGDVCGDVGRWSSGWGGTRCSPSQLVEARLESTAILRCAKFGDEQVAGPGSQFECAKIGQWLLNWLCRVVQRLVTSREGC